MRDNKKVRVALIAVILTALALAVYLLFFKELGGFFDPILNPETSIGDSSDIGDNNSGDGDTDITTTEVEDSEDDTENALDDDESYYAVNYSDFFTFNGHSAAYSFQNDKVLKANVDAGGQVSVGEVGGSVQGKQTGVIINARYTGGNKNHTYGIQIFDGYEVGFFAVSGSNGIQRMDSFDEWQMSASISQNGTISSNTTGTMLYWRTWDQQFAQEYQDSTNFGLIWTYDEPTAYDFDVQLLMRLYDYTSATELGVYRIVISYDESTSVYSLSSIEPAPFLEFENDGSLVQAAKEKLKSYALESFQSGVFYTTFNDAGEDKSIDLTVDDVRVFDVPEMFWCEIVNTDGEVIRRGEITATGSLTGVVIEKTDSSHGPITMYYTVSYEKDEDGNKTPLCSLVGYDWLSEKKWETFMIRNGFTISENRVEQARTDDLYCPKWGEEAASTTGDNTTDTQNELTEDIPDL